MNYTLLYSFLGPFTNQMGDSVRLNLASSFVNGFVNCGFGVDKILTETDEANRWFAKNREYGKKIF